MACYNYCVTYYPIDLPVDLYVRYSRCSDDTTVTELISTLETVDNLDGTYTACISVSDTGSYPTPVCVQGGLEIVCPTGIVWVNTGLSITPTATPTLTPTPTSTYVEYTITTFGYATTNDACASLNPGVTVYAEAGNTVPIVSMIFYDNTGLTTPYNGGSLSQYYLLTRGATTWAAQVDTSGVLTDYAICNTLPTPTPTTTSTPPVTPSNSPTPNITPSNSPTPPIPLPVTPTPTQTPTQTPTTTPLYVEYQITSFGYGNANLACDALDSTGPVYAAPGYTVPMVGMFFYDDTNLTLPHNGGGSGQYFLLEKLGVTWGAQVDTVGELTNYSACATLTTSTPTQTETPTQTPSHTQTPTPDPTPSITASQTQTPTTTTTLTATPTQTGTAAVTPTQTPTTTTTLTATPTQTGTAAVTPTQTQTQTPTPSVTIGLSPTATETPTKTPTQTPTQTTTQTSTQTQTPTKTPTQTPTQTTTQTSTQTSTPTKTPTQTQTPTTTTTLTSTPTPTAGYTVQFADCTNNTNIFRFYNVNTVLNLGAVYLIAGSSEYDGCATVVTSDGSGPLYDGNGVSFTQTASGCADPVCPRVSNRPALLYKCSDSTIFYANVEEDTAFIGAAYLYNGECYSFVEFSGPGGPNIGDPDYEDCIGCIPTPTPTSTPQSTPTNTPTVSVTPSACTYTDFCFYTMLPSLSGYSGNYTLDGTYNSKDYYTGDGTITAVIYYTGSYWCLASGATPGGTCVLQGATPCYSQCPDIAANDFVGGICPTPTPTPVDCSIFNFNAYFDCDWEPLPTPTPSVACDDVNFIINSAFVTPTPTPSGDFCGTVGISFSMSGYTPAVTPTITLTPSITLTRTVDVAGQVKFNMLDETFSCVSVKVLTDCQTGVEYYVNDNLIYDGIPVVTGITMFASINETNVCATYTRDDSNFSANATVDAIFQIYTICGSCSTLPTPTPTVTSTPTNTPSLTPSKTPTNTPTQTLTPSPTSTIGSTPPPTPTQTQSGTPTTTPTKTMTPTPSTTPNYVYVYQSCSPIRPNLVPTQIIQSEKVTFATESGAIFKDTQGICWTYLGRFLSTYIAGSGVTTITYTGNYFSGIQTTLYSTCQLCETLPLITCATYQYWSGTRCDNGQTIIVKSCYSEPTPYTINTFEFGVAGTTIGYLDFNVKVGEIAVGNDGTSDFCITINSGVGVQNASYTVSKPFGPTITSCSACPTYRKYTARACDNSEQNVTIYTPTSVAPFAFAGSDGGNIVSVSTSSTCYTILNYDGIVIDYYITPSTANFVLQGYADCQLCSEASVSRGGGGGGGGGASS